MSDPTEAPQWDPDQHLPELPEQRDYRADPSLAGLALPQGWDHRADPAAGGTYQTPGLDREWEWYDGPNELKDFNSMALGLDIPDPGWSPDSLETALRTRLGSDL